MKIPTPSRALFPLQFLRVRVYPLYENNTQSDLILLHYSGVSGPLNEKVEFRTKAKLNEFKFKVGNNVVYDNGESFIIVPNN